MSEKIGERHLMRRAMLYGTATASFCVEGFSVEGLERADRSRLEARFNECVDSLQVSGASALRGSLLFEARR